MSDQLRDLRVCVEPGDGVVASFGHAVLVALPQAPPHSAFVDGLLATLDANVAEHGAEAGRRVARQVARMLVDADPDDVPPFAIVAQAGGSVAVVVHGPIDLELDGAGGTHQLSGERAATWVDRMIEDQFDRLVVGATGHTPGPPGRWSDLQFGVAQGAGFTMVPYDARRASRRTGGISGVSSPASAPSPPPLPPPQPPEPPASTPPGSTPTESAPPDATEPRAPSPPPPAAPAPTSVTTGVGVLITDDGERFRLDRHFVIGREPEEDPEVVAGRAVGLLLDDPERVISRVHLRLVVDGQQVSAVDADSANGSYVSGPGEDNWRALSPNEPTPLEPDSRIMIGDRCLSYELERP